MRSQQNPIGVLVIAETVPSLSGTSSKHGADDAINEKGSVDIEDVVPTLSGRCLSGDGYKDVSWTIEEQRRAVRKVDFFLLPIFMVSLFEYRKRKGSRIGWVLFHGAG
jgi:hypothetical protein